MRTAVACCAAIATAVGVGACGSGVPSNAIAVVGGAPVTDAQFAHWLAVANNQPYVGTGNTPPAVPVPPDYTACVASERLRNPSGTTITLKAQCATTYGQLNQEVTALLIEGIWFQGEANRPPRQGDESSDQHLLQRGTQRRSGRPRASSTPSSPSPATPWRT